MPVFCYFWIKGRLVGLLFGGTRYLELGLEGTTNDMLELNRRIGVTWHEFLLMCICSCFGWDSLTRLSKFSDEELEEFVEIEWKKEANEREILF